MKLQINTAKILYGMLFMGMLGACRNESDNLITPQQEKNSAENSNARTNTYIPQLLENGSIKLEYNLYGPNIGKLSKQTYDVGKRWDYTYGNQLITAKNFNQYGTKLSETSYWLDANGRCIQSYNTLENKTFKYEYNEFGQLKKRYNKNAMTERQEFFYTSVDPSSLSKELTLIKFYNAANNQYQEVGYDYALAGSPVKEDKYPLNPEYELFKCDKYLPIFGKFHSKLVKFDYIKPVPYNGAPFDNNLHVNYTDAMTGLVFLHKVTHYISANQQSVVFEYPMKYTPDQTATAAQPKWLP